MDKILNKKILIPVIISIVAIVLTIVIVRNSGLKKAKEKADNFHESKYQAEFDGAQVPKDFNGQFIADILHESMKGAGTDETRFFTILDPLNKDQKTVVHNAFNATYGIRPCISVSERMNPFADCSGANGEYLREFIESDFSGASLNKALAHFSHIPNFNRNKI